MAAADLTAARLRELLHYDPETGVFTNRRTVGRVPFGARRGGLQAEGYRCIELDRIKYPEHRLAWLYMTGEWPKNTVDHLNGERADNRFVNLRDVTRSVNKQNTRKAYKGSKSGLLGVAPHGDRWTAGIQLNKRRIHLGRFTSPEEAHQAYLSAKRKIHEGNTL